MNNLYPQLLLLGVLIVFCLIGSMKYSRLEGYTQEELPIPQCNSGACHDDDYILKSQIVPPVCPACPGFGHKEDKEKKEDKEEPKEDKEEPKEIEEEVEKQEKQETKQQESKNYSFKQEITKKENPKENPNNFGLGLLNNPSKLLGNQQETNIDDQKSELEELKKKLEEMKKYEGNCPPCPACERCPEPSFDCKKVPNYRSTSVGQYLPIPVLNDFSRFS